MINRTHPLIGKKGYRSTAVSSARSNATRSSSITTRHSMSRSETSRHHDMDDLQAISSLSKAQLQRLQLDVWSDDAEENVLGMSFASNASSDPSARTLSSMNTTSTSEKHLPSDPSAGMVSRSIDQPAGHGTQVRRLRRVAFIDEAAFPRTRMIEWWILLSLCGCYGDKWSSRWFA